MPIAADDEITPRFQPKGDCSGSISTPGFDTQAGGFLAGFDKAVSANFTVGVAAGYLHTNLSEAGGASGSLDTPRFAVYGTYQDDVKNLSQIWAVAPVLVKLALQDDQPSQR